MFQDEFPIYEKFYKVVSKVAKKSRFFISCLRYLYRSISLLLLKVFRQNLYIIKYLFFIYT